MFEGLGVALVTPFRTGDVDLDALARLTSHLAESHVRSFYPCGCTGEATSLTREERVKVIRTMVEAAKGRAAVIAGTGTALTSETIEISKEAIRAGVDGVMVISPYSVKPTQEGLLAHYRAVAEAVDRPIVLYNVPSRTGVSILPETVARLAEHPRIAAIKEASGSVDQTSAIRARCDITVLSGASGRMGRAVRDVVVEFPETRLSVCVSRTATKAAAWMTPDELLAKGESALPQDAVVIDVSLAQGTERLLDFLERSPRALV